MDPQVEVAGTSLPGGTVNGRTSRTVSWLALSLDRGHRKTLSASLPSLTHTTPNTYIVPLISIAMAASAMLPRLISSASSWEQPLQTSSTGDQVATLLAPAFERHGFQLHEGPRKLEKISQKIP